MCKQFSIRELLLLTGLIGMSCGWWRDQAAVHSLRGAELERAESRINALQVCLFLLGCDFDYHSNDEFSVSGRPSHDDCWTRIICRPQGIDSESCDAIDFGKCKPAGHYYVNDPLEASWLNSLSRRLAGLLSSSGKPYPYCSMDPNVQSPIVAPPTSPQDTSSGGTDPFQ